jgi:hypothetical protein
VQSPLEQITDLILAKIQLTRHILNDMMAVISQEVLESTGGDRVIKVDLRLHLIYAGVAGPNSISLNFRLGSKVGLESFALSANAVREICYYLTWHPEVTGFAILQTITICIPVLSVVK